MTGRLFVHRTGHSAGTGVSIEPGVYFEGRFGVRSEVDVYIEPGDGVRGARAIVTGEPIQREVVALLA